MDVGPTAPRGIDYRAVRHPILYAVCSGAYGGICVFTLMYIKFALDSAESFVEGFVLTFYAVFTFLVVGPVFTFIRYRQVRRWEKRNGLPKAKWPHAA